MSSALDLTAPPDANWFIGLPLDGAFLATLPPPPPNFRLFGAHDVHLTVAFLGRCGPERAARALEALDEALAAQRFEPIAYSLGAVVPMGNPRRYSALSALLAEGREPATELMGALREDLWEAAEATPDTRPPLPHATIARPQRRAEMRDRAAGLRWASRLDLSWVRGTIDRIALFTWAERRDEGLFRVVGERPLSGA